MTGMTTAIVPVNHRTPTATPKAIADDVSYAIQIATGYRDWLAARGIALEGQRVLELGPGPSLGPAVCLAVAGAKVTCADLYPAKWSPTYHAAFYRELRARLATAWPGADLRVITRLLEAGAFDPSVVQLVEAGAEDLDVFEEGAFDLVLSNAVLEHVRDVPAGLFQMARVTAPGGYNLHSIDFRDHRDFERPLEYLTFDSARFARLFSYVRGECGNRWRGSQFVRGFALAGFEIDAFDASLFSSDGYQQSIRARLSAEFATFTDDDLRILSGLVVARRNHQPAAPVPEDIGPPTPPKEMKSFPSRELTPMPMEWSAGASISRLASDRPRVLVTRSCRMPWFEAAVKWIRTEYPAAEIVALSHRGFSADLKAAGVDDVIEVGGKTLGVWNAGVSTLWQLRRKRFDRVVIPQMDDTSARHANLYRVALATGAPSIVIAGPAGPFQELKKDARFYHTAASSLAGILPRFDVPLALALLAAARLAPRRRASRPAASSRIKVLHIISSWGVGGAQVQLAELLNRTPADRYQVHVVVLGQSDGEFSRCRLQRDDVTFTYLQWFPSLTPTILEIAGLCRRESFDIVHTWLFYANFLGSAGARLAGVPYVISGVRNLSLWKRAWNTKWWYRPADILGSRLPDRLTVNATPLVADHAWWAMVPKRRIDVIPNGLDTRVVHEGVYGARESVRRELGLPASTRLIGTVGRMAPEKDQATFVKLAARVLEQEEHTHAVLVGDGPCRGALERLAAETEVRDRIHFVGTRTDSRQIIAALDTFVLTSLSEGFPNVLLEATLLGTPAVSTDVAGAGDVLDGEDLFPLQDVEAGAETVMRTLLDQGRAAHRAAYLRQRSEQEFSAERMAERWFALYAQAPVRQDQSLEQPLAVGEY